MDAEIFMNADKLVVAKEGFDASNPSLPEGNKLFDSDWLFAGTIVEAGLHVDKASYSNAKRGSNIGGYSFVATDEVTGDSYTQIINFSPLPFVPTVMLLPLSDSRYWGDHGMVLLGVDKADIWGRPSEYWREGEITVTNSQIHIPRCYSKGGKWYYREDFIYLIMAM